MALVKKTVACLLVLLGFASSISAQINITGKVADAAGAGIPNAEVHFPKHDLKILTGADGRFTLTGSAVSLIDGREAPAVRRPAIQSGAIVFRLAGSSAASVRIYTVQGRLLGQWQSGRSPGAYRVPLQVIAGKQSSTLLIVTITIGQTTTWLKHYSVAAVPHWSNMRIHQETSAALFRQAATPDTLRVTAGGYIPKLHEITVVQGDVGVITLEKFSADGKVYISIEDNSPAQVFGAAKIEAAVKALGLTPVVVPVSSATGNEQIKVRLVSSTDDPALKKEGFRIKPSGSAAYSVTAIDQTGAMYGLMELAEQIQLNGLTAIAEKMVNPRFEFRAIKYNLPWSSYRINNTITVNQELSKDKKMWAAFIDMMAEDRLNALTLWSLHPYPYFIRATNFPKACAFTDAELAVWKDLWSFVFKRAKERGIDTYLINWNIIVSEGFKTNYGGGNTGLWANGWTSPNLEKYMKESVTQVINEYPDLSGLGITVGEAMQGWTSQQEAAWFNKTFFDGIKAANRKVKFIYRAALDGEHQPHRDNIDNSGLGSADVPIIVELKFNWSHAHSTTTLVKAHGGGTGSEYWENPAPTKHKMGWMIRNEDFFRLRWGEPDFIREHIQKNGQAFVGGYFIGSECYIPAKDIYHKPGHAHVSWKYAFERQWLYYLQWGRLLYDPSVPDAVFANAFNQRYSGNVGAKMTEAYKLSTRTTQRIAQSFDFTWDHSFYTEGFIANDRNFIDMQEMLNQKPIEPGFVSIKDYGNGTGNYGSRVTPLKLADNLVSDNQKALDIVNGIATSSETLKCEIADVRAWAHLGLYFAKKLRACVAVNQNKKAEAITHITEAQQHWRDLVTVTDEHIQTSELAIVSGTWHWKNFQADVDADVAWVKSR